MTNAQCKRYVGAGYTLPPPILMKFDGPQCSVIAPHLFVVYSDKVPPQISSYITLFTDYCVFTLVFLILATLKYVNVSETNRLNDV